MGEYVLLSPLWHPGSARSLLDVGSLIAEIHHHAVQRSYEIHAVIVLPTPGASHEERAATYEALKEIEANQQLTRIRPSEAKTRFDFLWILRKGAVERRVARLIDLLAVGVCRPFNATARNTLTQQTFLQRSCSYSWFDSLQLLFPARQVQEILARTLATDIINKTIIIPPDAKTSPDPLGADRMEEFLHGLPLTSAVAELNSKSLDLDVTAMVEDSAGEDSGGDIAGFIDNLYRKLDVLFERARERTIRSDIESRLVQSFTLALRSRLTELMDRTPYGICSAQAFVRYILNKKRIGDGDRASALHAPSTLHTILLQPVRDDLKAVLEADVAEILNRQLAIYGSQALNNVLWRGMDRTKLEQVCDLEAIVDLTTLPPNNRVLAVELKRMREEISLALEWLDKLVPDTATWKKVFDALELLVKLLARDRLLLVRQIRESMLRAQARLEEHKRKGKPLICGRKKYGRVLAALREAHRIECEQYDAGKLSLAAAIMERKNVVFHQSLVVAMHASTVTEAAAEAECIDMFISTLEKEKRAASTPEDFDGDELTESLLDPAHVVHLYPGDERLADLLSGFWKSIHQVPEPEVSNHYRRPEMFRDLLRHYCFESFAWVNDLTLNDVFLRLKLDVDKLLEAAVLNLRKRAIVRRFPEDRVEE